MKNGNYGKLHENMGKSLEQKGKTIEHIGEHMNTWENIGKDGEREMEESLEIMGNIGMIIGQHWDEGLDRMMG